MKKLLEINEVKRKIESGENLILAGDEELLNKLPVGKWIGGTIPYFMDADGGSFCKDKIFVDEVPVEVASINIKVYNENSIKNVACDSFSHGYSMIIIPANSKCHKEFAENSNKFKNIFNNPLVGWISGIDLNDLGKIHPKVYDGTTGKSYTEESIVMHLSLPENKAATVDIINLFKQGNGDTIVFDSTGFSSGVCSINGKVESLASYLKMNNIDTKLPLVADYCGAMINTSFQTIDDVNDVVTFYAPVFESIEYKIAEPIDNYVKRFNNVVSNLNIEPVFTCNCILNYLYSDLEGKKTGSLTGPMTFGEIAYQLLNQTLVYLTIVEI